jgi:hypothetical protein
MKAGWILAGLAVLAVPARAQVQVDINTNVPNANAYFTTQSSMGWYFTPSSSFFLTALQTRFNSTQGSNGNRLVTAEIWSNRPAVGGSLIASGAFQSNSALGILGGASFNSLLLQAGIQYFIGFRNVQGLGVNFAFNPSTSLGPRYFSRGPNFTDDRYERSASEEGAPILRLVGTESTVVPEPMTMTLLATGLVGIGAAGYIKRRRSSGAV